MRKIFYKMLNIFPAPWGYPGAGLVPAMRRVEHRLHPVRVVPGGWSRHCSTAATLQHMAQWAGLIFCQRKRAFMPPPSFLFCAHPHKWLGNEKLNFTFYVAVADNRRCVPWSVQSGCSRYAVCSVESNYCFYWFKSLSTRHDADTATMQLRPCRSFCAALRALLSRFFTRRPADKRRGKPHMWQ